MITKLDLYKVFCRVGKCKSCSKVAKEIYMTQHSVSQSIMKLN
ncbi:regulatory helix-turn-helix protein, lysR family [Clostridium gasigenes]|uniref:Regulatory helix-turn-helix protein, lysR family n=1 Tax=Clostridium gasigenes TaxID=94869 RepID=A0A1H0R5C1_9CLOT|nr:regulatory helix-turn-helix protein, lysR family [Clostridium gasigenes]